MAQVSTKTDGLYWISDAPLSKVQANSSRGRITGWLDLDGDDGCKQKEKTHQVANENSNL